MADGDATPAHEGPHRVRRLPGDQLDVVEPDTAAPVPVKAGHPASRAARPVNWSRAACTRYRLTAVSLGAAPGWLSSPRVCRGHIPSDAHSRVMVMACACPSSANQEKYRSLASPAYRHTGQPGLVSRSAAPYRGQY